uniref:Core shell protein Gag P30 domain-containing protein n=1 Tax=Micrurus lemniscatus lemniscatus TaxID=129467 RepID=A0A2D4H9G8_MICLE
MNILFTGEERDLIRKAAMTSWDNKHPPTGNNGGPTGEQKFALQKPNWQSNNEQDRRHMEDLREIITEGVKEAVPKNQNLNKAFEIYQDKDEALTTFLQRLKDHMRKYSGRCSNRRIAEI